MTKQMMEEMIIMRKKMHLKITQTKAKNKINKKIISQTRLWKIRIMITRAKQI